MANQGPGLTQLAQGSEILTAGLVPFLKSSPSHRFRFPTIIPPVLLALRGTLNRPASINHLSPFPHLSTQSFFLICRYQILPFTRTSCSAPPCCGPADWPPPQRPPQQLSSHVVLPLPFNRVPHPTPFPTLPLPISRSDGRACPLPSKPRCGCN